MVGGKTTRHKAKERLIGLQRLAELQQIAIVVDRKLSHAVIEVFERFGLSQIIVRARDHRLAELSRLSCAHRSSSFRETHSKPNTD